MAVNYIDLDFVLVVDQRCLILTSNWIPILVNIEKVNGRTHIDQNKLINFVLKQKFVKKCPKIRAENLECALTLFSLIVLNKCIFDLIGLRVYGT